MDQFSVMELCIVNCVFDFNKLTEPFRSKFETELDPLLRSIKKTQKGESAQTISNWILSNASIDTSKFQAHSGRMVSTSCAYKTGVRFEADWSNAIYNWRFYKGTKRPKWNVNCIIFLKWDRIIRFPPILHVSHGCQNGVKFVQWLCSHYLRVD